MRVAVMSASGYVLFGTVLFATMSIVGLIFYVLFVVAVVTSKRLRENPFYVFSLSLAVCDCIFLLITLFYSTPVTYAQKLFGFTNSGTFGPEHLNAMVGWLVQLVWFPSLPMIGVLAFNRYIYICKGYTQRRRWFGRRAVWIWTIACWTLGLLIGLPSFHECCHLIYELVITDVNAEKRRKREVSMFVQFFVLSMLLLVFDLSLNVLPYVYDGEYLGLWISFTYLVNCSANGYIYFALNTDIRLRVLRILKTQSLADIPITSVASRIQSNF